MRYSLRTKLSLSYVLIALISVFLISIMANYFMDSQFKNYVTKKQDQRSQEIASLLGKQFNSNNGTWANDVIVNIGTNALSEGFIIKVVDKSGNSIWDATVHNNGLCAQMLMHMSQNMQSRYPNWKGGYVQKRYPLHNNFKTVGYVDIGYYGPFFYSDSDLAFINTLNNILIGVGLVSLLFALLLGALMAKRLSDPISRVIETSQMIGRGYFGARINEKSNTKEICQLTATVNNLAETLENQAILRKRLTADVAHELRTPLATLRSHLEAMIDGVWEPDNERLTSCHEELMRLTRMVGELEKLARYESENMNIHQTEFDLAECMRQIVQNFEGEYLAKGVAISYGSEHVDIVGDEDKLSQVIRNLLSNALKYTPQGGHVEVSIKTDRDRVMLRVKDNGIGISPEDLPNIFERFYRADKSRNRQTGGLGIGLAIVKAIVEAHKGTITANSSPHEGTEFTVYLPKKCPDDSALGYT